MTLLPIWKLSLCTNRESQWVPVKSSSLHGARCSMFGAAGEHETHCENWEICLWFSRWRRKTGLWKTVGMFWLLRVTKGEPSTTCTRWMMTMSIIFNSQNDIVIWILCIFLCVVVCDTTIHTTSTRTFNIRGTVCAEPQTGFDGWSPDGVWWYRQWLKCYVGYSLKPNWVNRARAVQHGLDNDLMPNYAMEFNMVWNKMSILWKIAIHRLRYGHCCCTDALKPPTHSYDTSIFREKRRFEIECNPTWSGRPFHLDNYPINPWNILKHFAVLENHF